MLYAKLIEIHHQLLHLAKVVQRGFAVLNGRREEVGTYSLPDGVSLPLNSTRAVNELEEKLFDHGIRCQMVSS
jgi:hypothetical protein